MSDPILARWTYRAETRSTALVFPDGCQDVIRIERPGQTVSWIVTTLDDRARQVVVPEGTLLEGWRMMPGSRICGESVHRLSTLTAVDDSDVSSCGELSEDVNDVLAALSDSVTLDRACRVAGVSRRTMQRTIRAMTGRPPSFWMQLGRARRAARALSTDAPLSGIAVEHGFSDQAHMTREFRRWFALTPGRLRATPVHLEVIRGPGFG